MDEQLRIDEVRFAGYQCIRMRCGELELLATHSAGPRIIGFRRRPQPNILVLLPERTIERPGLEPFRFIGGHRLWVAPEVDEVTYAPDEASVDVTTTASEVLLTAPEDEAGFRKTMTIRMTDATVTVEHEVTNLGSERTVAPWAITQLVPGGTALMPLGTPDAGPYQASSNIVAWPYTDLADPLIRIEPDRIEIEAKRIDPIKIGTKLRRGWLAYKLNDSLFVKRATTVEGMPYPDLDASGQCYAIRDFIELETVGPLSAVSNGETVTHVETWELHVVDQDIPIATAVAATGVEP